MKIFLRNLLLLPLLVVLAGCAAPDTSESPTSSGVDKTNASSGVITIAQNNIDLGEIPIEGGDVEATFTFTNNGEEAVTLLSGETSCMCTEAVITSSDGDISPRIKMAGHGAIAKLDQVILPGEQATLVATFDPMAHGPNALGQVKRDVIVQTDSQTTPQLRFSFRGDVIGGSQKSTIASPMPTDEVNTELFAFAETSHDFGTIKQSGGKVSHDFAFVYNGNESLKITGVPTSCACTSAKVTPTDLNPGDSGILTVTFNPNLHEEPEGKFFKTVSLLTEPALAEIPEVKIWTEIDLDLGSEAFELKARHDEDEEEAHQEPEYTSITPAVFATMLEQKDFVLIDTHIPEQEHIAGTDAFIPYDTILESAELPADKNTKIVLYCRSGSMSRAAAYQLAEEGYKNVYDLVGGKIAYDDFVAE